MSAPKTRNNWGLLAKLETTYGTAVALAGASDGILTLEQPDVAFSYLHDGSRNGMSPGMGSPLRKVNKSGRLGALTVVHEASTPGTAYSALVMPSVHTLMRICGFDAVTSFTGGSEKYDYQVVVGAFASATLEAYVNGMKYALAGVYGDLNISGAVGSVPKWEAALQGISTALPGDVAVPAITYPNNAPIKLETAVVTIGNYLPVVVKEFSYALGRTLGPRAYDNSQGRHGGLTPGRINPTLELIVEMQSLANTTPWNTASTLNPYGLEQDANVVPVSMRCGAGQYSRYTIGAVGAQLLEMEEVEDGPTSQWRLKFQLSQANVGGSDGHTIKFD